MSDKVNTVAQIRDASLGGLILQSTYQQATRLCSADGIHNAPVNVLLAMQQVLKHGDTLGLWSTPENWLPKSKQTCYENIDLRVRLQHFLKKLSSAHKTPACDALVSYATEALSRYLLLLRQGPSGMGRKGANRPLSPSSIVGIAYIGGPALYALAIDKHLQTMQLEGRDLQYVGAGDAGAAQLLSTVDIDGFSKLPETYKKNVHTEFQRMQQLASLGHWHDVPRSPQETVATAMQGQPRTNPEKPKPNEHLPLPDEYVAEMGQKSLWLSYELAPGLIEVAEKIGIVWAETKSLGLSETQLRAHRSARTEAILRNHIWTDSQGRILSNLPFPIKQSQPQKADGKKKSRVHDRTPRWPPESWMDVMGWLGFIQSGHYFVAGLSMGTRQSEGLSLERSNIIYAPDGFPYATGKTFKLVERHDGELRDWVLPDAAVDVLEKQARLVKAVEKIANLVVKENSKRGKQLGDDNSTFLWAQLSSGTNVSDATKCLKNINTALKNFAEMLQMSLAPGKQSLRSHRLRKTLARLVALAVTQAPKLLMDIFGHKTIEMTLYYILADKELRVEAEKVARELTVMRAKEVVEKMVEADVAPDNSSFLGGYGGRGAITIRDAVESYRAKAHRRGEDWGSETAEELAQMLTCQGVSWVQVRRGVICTKLPGEAGPCNKKLGKPEPGKCNITCTHRLEEGFLREDVDASITDCLRSYSEACQDSESLTAAHWAAQIRAQVPRFPDLQAKWMADPIVFQLMKPKHQESVLNNDN